jgi:hypothetical protein
MSDGIETELAEGQLHDVCPPKRLARLRDRLRQRPRRSWPAVGQGWAEAVAADRFLENPALGIPDILSGPIPATRVRLRAQAGVWLVQDTTVLDAGTTHPKGGRGTVKIKVHAEAVWHPTVAGPPVRVTRGRGGCRSGSGQSRQWPRRAKATPGQRTRVPAGWQALHAPVRSNRPVRPPAACPWPRAPGISRRGGTGGPGSQANGRSVAGAPRRIGAGRREPRSGLGGARCRTRVPGERAPWPAPANRLGRSDRFPGGDGPAGDLRGGAPAGRHPAARDGQRGLCPGVQPPQGAAPGAWLLRTRRPVTDVPRAGTVGPW